MAIINPSSAIIAKVKYKYGNRLKEKDYSAMLKCQSVQEVMSYLKTHTMYKTFLSKVNEHGIHRSEAEQILRRALFNDILILCKYIKNDSIIVEYVMRQMEIEQILKFITLLSIHKPEEYIFTLPLYFVNHSEINLKKLIYCDSFDDLLNLLNGSHYKIILQKFPPDKNGRYDISAIENELESYYFSLLFERIKKIKSKKQREEINNLLNIIIDFNNFERIIRIKNYYSVDADQIKTNLLPFGAVKDRVISRICKAESVDNTFDIIYETSSGKKIKKTNFNHIGKIFDNSKYELCKNKLYFSSNPEVVALSYIILTRIELNNIINIIEGVRYSLDRKIINDLIIY